MTIYLILVLMFAGFLWTWRGAEKAHGLLTEKLERIEAKLDALTSARIGQ